jgi:hypothetical protein
VAIAALRRSRWVSHFAVAAGTLLVCDAWFDVLTARGETDVALAVAGLAAELPLAVLCFVIARRTAPPTEG